MWDAVTLEQKLSLESFTSWYFNGEPLLRYAGHQTIANDVNIDPTGTMLASVSRDFTVKVFHLRSGELLHCIPLGNKSLKSVCFWAEDLLIIGDYWGTMMAINLNNQEITRARIALNGISAIARNGKHLIAVSYEGIAFLVDPYSLKIINHLRAMYQKVDLTK